jgi:hypothetical protein
LLGDARHVGEVGAGGLPKLVVKPEVRLQPRGGDEIRRQEIVFETRERRGLQIAQECARMCRAANAAVRPNGSEATRRTALAFNISKYCNQMNVPRGTFIIMFNRIQPICLSPGADG